VLADGFSASRTGSTIATGTQLLNWIVTSPYYGNPAFNPAAGVFTVPTTGRYAIKATLSYSTTAAINLSIGAGVNPAFAIRRTIDGTNLIVGFFPILNVNVTLLNLRAVLGTSSVTLAGDVTLNSGDTIGIFYVSDGLTVNLNLGSTQQAATVWSMHRLT